MADDLDVDGLADTTPMLTRRLGFLLLLLVAAVALLTIAMPRPQLPSSDRCDSLKSTTSAIELQSEVYGSMQRVIVHRPPCTGEPVGVLFLLHGAGRDETEWVDVGAPSAIDKLIADTGQPVVLVMPDAGPAYPVVRSSNNEIEIPRDQGPKLAQHLVDEIEPALQSAGINTDRMAIGGISWGGGLAFETAAARPGAFIALGAHSPAGIEPYAIEALAEARIPIRLDVGQEDSLADVAIDTAADFDVLDIEHEFELNSGAHEQAYWHEHLDEYLMWYARHLHR